MKLIGKCPPAGLPEGGGGTGLQGRVPRFVPDSKITLTKHPQYVRGAEHSPGPT
jgi:hypothetical protein